MRIVIIFLSMIIPNLSFSYQFYYNQPSNTTYRVFSASVQNLKQEGRSETTIEQAYEAMLRVGELSKEKEVLFNGEYRISFRLFGQGRAYESGDSKVYNSLFRRNLLGHITSLSTKDYYPAVRSIPEFTSRDIKVGETWKSNGIEVQDFNLLGYPSPFVLPFKAEYVYVGDVNLNAKDFERLTQEYKNYRFTISEESQSLMEQGLNTQNTKDGSSEYAIIGVLYHINYGKNDFPTQTKAIRDSKAVPVERASGYYKGIVFWNKKTREEAFSLGEYDFTYFWENGEKRHWTGKEYGYVDIFKQDEKAIDSLEKVARKSLDKSIEVEKKKEGIKLIFGDILFNFNKVNLKKQVINMLKQVSTMLKNYPKAVLRITGHSDDIGSTNAKNKISQGRAKAVTDFLVDNGINADRIVFSGKGDSEPRLPNNGPLNRKKNRRVELEIITQ